MAYQLGGTDRFRQWHVGERADVRERVLTWLELLADDPASVEATPVPGFAQPVLATFVPGTSVAVTYLVIEQFRVVQLLEIRTLP